MRWLLALTIAGLAAGDAGRTDAMGTPASTPEFAQLARAFVAAVSKAARAALLEVGAREAEERCSSLLGDVSLALSFAGGLGVFAPDQDLTRAAFVASERTRGAAVLSSLWTRAARTDARYETLRRALQSASEDLARLAQRGATPEEFAVARVRREAAERALVGLAHERMEGGDALFAGDVASLSATLREEDALVAYRRYGDRRSIQLRRRKKRRQRACARSSSARAIGLSASSSDRSNRSLRPLLGGAAQSASSTSPRSSRWNIQALRHRRLSVASACDSHSRCMTNKPRRRFGGSSSTRCVVHCTELAG